LIVTLKNLLGTRKLSLQFFWYSTWESFALVIQAEYISQVNTYSNKMSVYCPIIKLFEVLCKVGPLPQVIFLFLLRLAVSLKGKWGTEVKKRKQEAADSRQAVIV
jgi:hypothetical protein